MKMRTAQVLELVVNLALPWAMYRLAQPYWGETGGLIASAVPPVIWSLVELARFRRADALSLTVLLGIVLSIGAMALGGDSRMLLMRESLVSGAIGVGFLLSLLLKRPAVFYLTRAFVAREMADGATHIERLFRERPTFARAMRILTATWGVGLTCEMLLRVWMAWHWPIERVLVVSPVVGYGIFGALMVWTFWYRRTLRELAGRKTESADNPDSTDSNTRPPQGTAAN
jgi:hypothetical protein